MVGLSGDNDKTTISSKDFRCMERKCAVVGHAIGNTKPGSMATLDAAIGLVTQAVHQDSCKNYAEAARYYRAAIRYFHEASANESPRTTTQVAIQNQVHLYEQRLGKLEWHLILTADFSRLFKDVVGEFTEGSAQERNLQALLDIDKAKIYDSQNKFERALIYYERGTKVLLDAARKILDIEEAQKLRIKCLLIHDRVDNIRNFLEHGAPLAVRKNPLNLLEVGSESEYPVPIGEDDFLFECDIPSPSRPPPPLMTYNSDNISIRGSTHSLYPRCEIKRSQSVASIQEDEDVPLAKLDKELQLSLTSLIENSHNDSTFDSIDEGRVSQLLETDMDGILVLDERSNDYVQTTTTTTRDDVYNKAAYMAGDNASDSGISDPPDGSAKSPSTRSRKSQISAIESDRKSPLSDTESIANHYFDNESKRWLVMRDDSYRPRQRYEYIPPRAFAPKRENHGNDNNNNNGCFYFMSCLDSFGIL